ncbi:MAG: hypothetical protein KDC98_07015, partial [Planctomycetes bacterium]|nr:hypothetical protein [Planctomycetota bacterium]
MASSTFPRVLGIAVLLGSLTPAQGPTPATARAWSAFQDEAPGSWIVRWHPATGTPQQIYGEGIDLPDWRENSLEGARRHANAALQRWAGLLGLGASDFGERIGTRM